MPVRKGTAPTRIRAQVEMKTAAERLTFNVLFVNMRTSEYMTMAEVMTIPEVLVQLVAEWDADYDISVDGFRELEDERPGTTRALLEAWHAARVAERSGN